MSAILEAPGLCVLERCVVERCVAEMELIESRVEMEDRNTLRWGID